MPRIGIRCPKDAAVLDGPNHTCHIKVQSFKIADDEAIIAEWSIGEIGPSCEGTSSGRLLS